jgi:hypothetical protein
MVFLLRDTMSVKCKYLGMPWSLLTSPEHFRDDAVRAELAMRHAEITSDGPRSAEERSLKQDVRDGLRWGLSAAHPHPRHRTAAATFTATCTIRSHCCSTSSSGRVLSCRSMLLRSADLSAKVCDMSGGGAVMRDPSARVAALDDGW